MDQVEHDEFCQAIRDTLDVLNALYVADFDADDSGVGEPLIAPRFEECPRCGGNGHETYFVGDMEYSMGRCTSCDGRGEIEVETFDAADGDAPQTFEEFISGLWGGQKLLRQHERMVFDADDSGAQAHAIEAARIDAAAARDAAWAAARDALKPTIEHLQISAVALVERMIEAKVA